MLQVHLELTGKGVRNHLDHQYVVAYTRVSLFTCDLGIHVNYYNRQVKFCKVF